MQKIILKFLYLVASLKYPHIRRDFRYFIRDNYFCRLVQVKYFFNDYFIRREYKILEFQGEFDQELRYVLPHAYWHYLNGTLRKTISCKNTKELYFFSQHHEERHSKRIWELSYNNFSIPNMTHSASFSYKKWARVPLKDHYRNDIFVFQKPILIIANKYNIEWDGAPLNFLDIPTLNKIITTYKDKYQIVYNRPQPDQIVGDNSDTLNLNEHDWMRSNHPEVLLMNDLYEQYLSKVKNFNHLQLLVYANSDRFVSAHGGTAAFASYFGGVNIILSKKGIEHELNEFNTIFPMLSGAKILHATTEVAVLEYLEEYY